MKRFNMTIEDLELPILEYWKILEAIDNKCQYDIERVLISNIKLLKTKLRKINYQVYCYLTNKEFNNTTSVKTRYMAECIYEDYCDEE